MTAEAARRGRLFFLSHLSSFGLDRSSLHLSTHSLYNFHPTPWTTHFLLNHFCFLHCAPCQRGWNPANSISKAVLPGHFCLGSTNGRYWRDIGRQHKRKLILFFPVSDCPFSRGRMNAAPCSGSSRNSVTCGSGLSYFPCCSSSPKGYHGFL